MNVTRFWFRLLIWLSIVQLAMLLMIRMMFPTINIWDFRHLPPFTSFIFLGGIIVGIIVTPMVKETTVTVSVDNRQDALHKLTTALSSEGYQPVLQQDDLLVFKQSTFPSSFLFPDPISIRLEEHTITLSGSTGPLKRLQKQIEATG